MTQVRIDLGNKAGRFDIAWIELTNEVEPGAAWVRPIDEAALLA